MAFKKIPNIDRVHFIGRNENFGMTIYDLLKLQSSFLSKGEIDNFVCSNEVQMVNNPLFEENKDILFSPIRVYYEMTLACNLQCKTCLNNSGKPEQDELDIDQAIKVIYGLKNDYVFDVRFTGGEPTQKPGWETIIQTAKNLGLITTLTSNGIYSEETLKKLIAIHPHETSISLDGFGKHNDNIRGKGSFKLATESIKKLKKAGCRVTINSLVTKLMDLDDVKRLLEFAEVYCDDISFFHMRPIGRAEYMKEEMLGSDDLHRFMEQIEKNLINHPKLKVRTRSSSLTYNSIGNEQKETFGLMEGGPDGFTRLNILSNGDIYAGGCVPYVEPSLRSKLSLGNIIQEDYSLLNVWRFSERLKRIREKSSELKRRCENCTDYKNKCSGFTLEMELYRQIDSDYKNPYCKK